MGARGRGTYVRSLIRDLGTALCTGGCLTSLIRTRVGPFSATDAWTIQTLKQVSGPEAYLIDLDGARDLLNPSPVEIPTPPAIQ